ncbi:hypothetical protein KAR52_03385 [Candidatus Pacearchaeota archaeon]|nr:hypothetical protein [Candidatus Pacearchaeota archaeon]
MVEYLELIARQFGISAWLVLIMVVWTASWKLVSLWKSARKGSVIWFVILAVFNTMGILPILYIFVFSKMKRCQFKIKKSSKKKSVKKKKK